MMRGIPFLLLLLILFELSAQKTLNDTVKIKTVSIISNNNVEQLHRLDSTELTNPLHTDLGDLLAKKSHLFVKSYGIGSLASVSLRGSGSAHTQLYWNGISINSSMNGSSDLALFPLFFMDEVNLNYGLRSVADGSGGIGGAINFDSKPQFLKKQQVELGGTIGSFGQRRYTGKIELGSEKFQSVTKLYYSEAENDFNYKDLTLEGFPTRRVVNASLEQKGIQQSFYYRPKEDHLFETQFWLFDSKRNLPPLITLRSNTEFQGDWSLKGMLGYHKYFQNSKLSIKTTFLQDELEYVNERASIQTKSKTTSYRSRIDYQLTLSKKLTAETQARFGINQAESPSFHNKLQEERISLFGNLKYLPISKLTLQFSARQLSIVDQESFFVPQFSADYQPFEKTDLHIYANAGKNVKYPNLNDLYFIPAGNPTLKAESSTSAEWGIHVSQKLMKGKVQHRTQLALFYSEIDHYIQWVPTAFGYWRPNNLDQVTTQGIEVNSELEQLGAKLTKVLSINYSYTSSVNHEKNHEFDESNGKQLVYIPIHKGNVSFLSSYQSYFATINQQFIGERFITSDNEEALPYYSLLDISFGKKITMKSGQIRMTVGVKNLLDTEYQAIEWRPMPNRNYFLQMVYQFNK